MYSFLRRFLAFTSKEKLIHEDVYLMEVAANDEERILLAECSLYHVDAHSELQVDLQDKIQLAHVSKVHVKHFNEKMDRFEVSKLIIIKIDTTT